MDSDFKRRRDWFDSDRSRFDLALNQAENFQFTFTCPCCCYPTLQERRLYDICCLCKWEDDGVDEPNLDWGSAPNHSTLRDARRNFVHHLNMYDSSRDNPVEIGAKTSMIEAFDAMIGEADTVALENLWRQVHEASDILTHELFRRTGD